MDNLEYQKSRKLWIESQEYLIEQLELQKKFQIDNIKINKSILKNVNKALKHEKKQLNEFL